MIRLNNNARIPVRGTPEAAGYDPTEAQSAVVAAHIKYLAKIGLTIAIPHGCYGRITLPSGLSLKRFIDVGAGVIDVDYREELDVV